MSQTVINIFIVDNLSPLIFSLVSGKEDLSFHRNPVSSPVLRKVQLP